MLDVDSGHLLPFTNIWSQQGALLLHLTKGAFALARTIRVLTDCLDAA